MHRWFVDVHGIGPAAFRERIGLLRQATHGRLRRHLPGRAHGGPDGNVPPYNTYLVIDALAKANKDYDLVLFPNAGHGYGEFSKYMMRRRWDYFVRHLKGVEPPKEFMFDRRLTP